MQGTPSNMHSLSNETPSTMALPTTIKVVHQPDAKSSRLILEEAPLPILTSPDHVLIKVIATAPCYSELTWAAQNPQFFPPDKEPVPGQDVAGVVAKAGASSAFKVGDAVFCRIDATRPGGLREYTVALESELALKPGSVGWVGAAATPLSALTAWQALFEHRGLDEKSLFGDISAKSSNKIKRVLITAAGGSVGGFAVQMAVAAGVSDVVGVASGSKSEQVLSLGASAWIDYKTTSIEEWARATKFDLVIDCVGGNETLNGLWDVVKDDGYLISVSDWPDRLRPKEKPNVTSKFFIVNSIGSQLAEIAKLLEKGSLRPLVDSVVDFADFQAAFDRLDTRTASGKIVIKVNAPPEERD